MHRNDGADLRLVTDEGFPEAAEETTWSLAYRGLYVCGLDREDCELVVFMHQENFAFVDAWVRSETPSVQEILSALDAYRDEVPEQSFGLRRRLAAFLGIVGR